MTYQQLMSSLKSGKLAPVYVLEGEEPFFIDRITDWFEQQVLPAEQATLNRIIVYGAETSASDIARMAINLPMFGDRQLIIVKEAQQLKGWDELGAYLERPAAHSVVVFCYKSGTFDRRTSVGKLMAERAVVFTSRRVSESQLPSFISQLAGEIGLQLTEEAALLLAEQVGNDLSRLNLELQKLSTALAGRKQVSADEVAQYVGVSREYNVFELTKALARGDHVRAYRIVDYFAANPKASAPYVITGLLYSFFSKVYVLQQQGKRADQHVMQALGIRPFLMAEHQQAASRYAPARIRRILSLLLEYDSRIKGIRSGADSPELIKELIFRILEENGRT
ncbi:MAG: DNA polymerase III subunit delta [Chitinophagales bacterium]|nr:DNA polymerase III subunit delta [Chitinophagales bacterium]MDW8428343.1 DNA polymerase III subunit delta [Chitinophagales bacterium]